MNFPRAHAEQKLTTGIGVGLLVALAALFFRGVFFGEQLFAVDFHLTFQPLRSILGEMLNLGSSGWNPRVSNGLPLSGNPLHAVFYPPNLLFRFVSAEAGLTWLTALHLLFGALGGFSLSKRQGLLTSGAVTSAAVIAFGGVAASATPYTNLCWSIAWVPWLMLGLELITGATSGWHAALGSILTAGATAALMLIGDPLILLTGALGGVMVVVDSSAWSHGRSTQTVRRWRWRRTLALVAPALVGPAIALPAMLIYLDYLPQSIRGAGFTHEGTTLWSWNPLTAIEALLPGFFGAEPLRRFDGSTGFWAAALIPEKGHPYFSGTYVGSLVVALALAGYRGKGYRSWILSTWFAILGVLALGKYGPFSMLFSLPPLEGLRYPVKWLLPASIPLALLAGRGVDRVERLGRRSLRPLLRNLLLATLLMTAVSLASQAPFVIEGFGGASVAPYHAAIRATILGSVTRGLVPVVVACVAAFLALRRVSCDVRLDRRCAQAVAGLIALVVGLDLVQANARFAPTTGPAFYDQEPKLVQAIKADPDGRQRVHIARSEGVQFRRDPSYAAQARGQRELLLGYTSTTYGLDLAFGPDTEALHPLRYMRLQVMVDSAPVRERLMLLGAAGVTHLVTHERVGYPGARMLADLRERTVPPLAVWTNPLRVPRARLVRSVVCYEGDQGFIRAVSGAEDGLFRESTLVALADLTSAGVGLQVCGDAPVHGSPEGLEPAVVALRDRGDELTVEVEGSGGWLIVNDTWLEGWSAMVDGDPAPLVRADYVFRGVQVPAGPHTVTMRYTPW